MASAFVLTQGNETELIELPNTHAINNQALDNHNLLGVSDDRQAIELWLSRFANKTHTLKAYLKGSERFYLWMRYNKLTLKRIGKNELDKFINFLRNPEPHDMWCSTVSYSKNIKRGSPNWRPFKSGLTEKSVKHCLTVVGSLFSFLVDAGYLLRNPVKLVNVTQKHDKEFKQYELLERIPTPEEWQLILSAIDDIKNKDEKARARFIIAMLFYTGLRISELESLRWNNFRKTQSGWSLFVVGKGDKPREIAVEDLIYEVIAYRRHLSLPAFPKNEDDGVVKSLDGESAISASQLFKIIKGLGSAASKKEGLDSYTAKRLKAFSPHWIRHLCPSLLAKAGVDARYIQQMLGHASSQTTDIYVHLFDVGRREAVKHLKI